MNSIDIATTIFTGLTGIFAGGAVHYALQARKHMRRAQQAVEQAQYNLRRIERTRDLYRAKWEDANDQILREETKRQLNKAANSEPVNFIPYESSVKESDNKPKLTFHRYQQWLASGTTSYCNFDQYVRLMDDGEKALQATSDKFANESSFWFSSDELKAILARAGMADVVKGQS